MHRHHRCLSFSALTDMYTHRRRCNHHRHRHRSADSRVYTPWDQLDKFRRTRARSAPFKLADLSFAFEIYIYIVGMARVYEWYCGAFEFTVDYCI